MIKQIQTLLLVGLLSIAGVGLCAAASDAPASASGSTIEDATRARAMLDRAVVAYRKNPRQALVDFSMVGPFIDHELYVYVVGEDGVMRASGGSSVALVGRDVRNLKDVDGKLFISEMLAEARVKDSGSVAYRWADREHGGIERKVAYFQKVGDAIIAVGYYIHRSSPQEAGALLEKATAAVKQDAKAAFARFNDINGGYTMDDLYVFVVSIDDMVMRANGASPRLVGRNVSDLRDVDGKRIFGQSMATVKTKGNAELRYTWRNPVTRRAETKITYLERVGNYAVGVGYYQLEARK